MMARRSKTPELGEGEEYELRPVSEYLYDAADPEQRKVISWRVSCFERLGFATTAAIAMAIRKDVDRERVEKVLDEGATLQQAVAIFL